MRRPIDGSWPVTGDRASHAEYGVGPATDYGVPTGTPVVAPFDGRVSTYANGVGGLGIIVHGADAAFYGQHLSQRLVFSGEVREGDRIALSGNTGTQTTGPHLHCYVILDTGERLSMEEYLTQLAATEARPFDPEPTPPAPTHHLEDDMPDPIAYAKGDLAADVYAIYTAASDTNNPTQGGAYCARRYVLPGELAIVEQLGRTVLTIPQADLDLLPKIAGSR